MRRLSATEAARRFSELLDRVERDGESFVVERRGRVVASITPAAALSGRDVKALLRALAADPDWQRELAQLRGSLVPEERRWARTMVTADAAGFDDLPGVDVRLLPASGERR